MKHLVADTSWWYISGNTIGSFQLHTQYIIIHGVHCTLLSIHHNRETTET